MPPILQRLITLALGVLLRFPLLCQMPLVIRHHLAHVGNIFLFILVGILLGILLQDLDDLATTVSAGSLAVFLLVAGCRHSSRLSTLPFMADTLTGAVALAPAGLLG